MINSFAVVFIVACYVFFLWFCFRRTALTHVFPSTFLAASIAVQCSPAFLLSADGGVIDTPYFSISIIPVVVLLGLGYYGAVLFYISIRRWLFPSQAWRVGLECMPPPWCFAFLFLMAFSYVFFTPRLHMLRDVVGALSAGVSSDINYLRRVEYADGFFVNKVYTWVRFSLSPIVALSGLALVGLRSAWGYVFFGGTAYIAYFCMSAGFHKSTWVLGFFYIAGFWILRKGCELGWTSKMYRVRLFQAGCGGTLLVLLTALAYGLQYRTGSDKATADHLIAGVDRVTGAVAWGLAAFCDTFPAKHDWMPLVVFGGPFYRGVQPEELVPSLWNLETTIQPGVLGSLYAGAGWGAVPLYWGYVMMVCFLADWIVVRRLTGRMQSVGCIVLGMSLAWSVQVPLWPSVFSSGLVPSFVIFLALSVLLKPRPSGSLMRDVSVQGS